MSPKTANAIIVCIALILTAAAPFVYASPAPMPDNQCLKSNPGLCFTENKGQWDDRVLYKAEGAGGLTWFIERDGFSVLYSIPDLTAEPLKNPRDIGMPEELQKNEPKLYPRKGHALKFRFVQNGTPPYSPPAIAGGETSPSPLLLKGGTEGGLSDSPWLAFQDHPASAREVISSDRLSHNNNYFLGNDRSKWAPNCGNFTLLTCRDVWDGIDVNWYEKNGLVEFDFVVNPGADLNQIQMRVDGLEGVLELTAEGGEIILPTSLGEVRMALPEAFQPDGQGGLTETTAQFGLTGESRLGVRMPEGYDASKKLIVDPLIYSTYLGGSSGDCPTALAPDGAGGVFVAGFTASNDFPVTEGAYDTSSNGLRDAFVTRLSDDDSELLYCTYLGGTDTDSAFALLAEGEGVVVAGVTKSNNFPTTDGAFDRSYNGNGDIFVTRLSSDGSELLHSTYFGAGYSEVAYAIMSDSAGGVFITGYASSGGVFPTTEGAYDRTANGFRDAFVANLNEDLSQLLYGTLLGSAGKEQAMAIASDGAGGVVVAGTTSGNDFPITEGAFDGALTGSGDAFVTRLSGDLSTLIYSTYLGGSGAEVAYALAPDGAGGVFVAGSTSSNDFPTTEDAYSQALNDTSDAFVARLSDDGDSLLYSTYLGGGNGDGACALMPDGTGGVFVAGYTVSDDFPTIAGAYDEVYNNNSDAFIARLDGCLEDLLYGTYLGGGSNDGASGLASDGASGVFVVGATTSNDFPTTGGAFDEALNGSSDGFVTHLGGVINHPPVLNPISDQTMFEGQTLAITLTGSDPDGDALTFECTGFTFPGMVTRAGDTYSFTAGNSDAGVYEVGYQVYDDGTPMMFDVRSFAITVSPAINVPGDYETIQAAINASHAGDLILVNPGTYTENIVLTGHNVTLASVWWYTYDAADIANTIIDGDGNGTVVRSEGNKNTARLTGFTITGGSGFNGGRYGGGIYLRSSKLAIDHCVITGNHAERGGGIFGLSCNSCNWQSCTIEGNSASVAGGGIMLQYSNTFIFGCDIKNNSAPKGGGIHLYGSNADLGWCVLTGNSASSGARMGGGISCVFSSSPTLTNCTFSGNAATYGGAILSYYDSHPVLKNTICWGDSPQEIYIKRQATHPSMVSVDYSDVKGGSGGQFVALGGTLDWGDGNLIPPDDDPLFVNAGSGDYHLQDVSPCIDTGDPASPDDPDGSQADMGAYFFDHGGRAPRLDIPDEVVIAPKEFSLGNAYPNPFNGAVRIPFSVPVSARVNVTLYDINGRQVAKLVDEVKPAGSHEVGWLANNAPTGVYLVQMSTAQYQKTQRLVLIK